MVRDLATDVTLVASPTMEGNKLFDYMRKVRPYVADAAISVGCPFLVLYLLYMEGSKADDT